MIDLITTTTGGGRASAFRALLQSLETQTDNGFSLIVIDQSADATVEALCRASVGSSIRRVSAQPCSLSRARNLGLQHAKAPLVGFPDDDCEYAPDVVQQVREAFDRYGSWGVVASLRDKGGGPAAGYRREGLASGLCVTPLNVFDLANSNGIFCRRDAALEFDERLGVGTRNGCGEETDMVLEWINKGHSLVYEPRIRVWHPASRTERVPLDKVGSYGRGFGACVAKALRQRAQWSTLVPLARVIVRSCGGVVLSGTPDLRRRYWARVRGVVAGFLKPW